MATRPCRVLGAVVAAYGYLEKFLTAHQINFQFYFFIFFTHVHMLESTCLCVSIALLWTPKYLLTKLVLMSNTSHTDGYPQTRAV